MSRNKVLLAYSHTHFVYSHLWPLFTLQQLIPGVVKELFYGLKSLKHVLSDPLRTNVLIPGLHSETPCPLLVEQMGSCCWRQEGAGGQGGAGEEGLWGISSLASFLWSLYGMAESVGGVHTFSQMVLKIQRPFLLCVPASALRPAPPDPGVLMSLIKALGTALSGGFPTPSPTFTFVSSYFSKRSSNC